jgi:hypothetical protein
MGGWTLQWDDDQTSILHSGEELDRLLDQIEADIDPDSPRLVVLESPDGQTSRSASAGATAWRASKSPWIRRTLRARDASAATSPRLSFFLGSHWSEFPRWQVIPTASARKALRRFFETGERPDNVDWFEI